MWKVLFFLALPLVPLAAAHERDGGGVPHPEVQCLIRAEAVASGVQLKGVVLSEKPLSGTYRFQVRKTGRAGTSDSAQSGTFETRRGEDVVSEVGLGLERGASYDATLELRWDGGETSCTARGPDRG